MGRRTHAASSGLFLIFDQHHLFCADSSCSSKPIFVAGFLHIALGFRYKPIHIVEFIGPS
jgi:hypothetical protein